MSIQPPSPLGLPASTYRIQFTPQFTFADAADLIPYLHSLGVTECYASPILAAREGSAHGYDTVDHSRVSTALGGEAGLKRLAAQLHERAMGLIVDIVPNHMCVTDDQNRWWQDVLEHGPASEFAEFFDIDWEPLEPQLHGKVLLPILADQPRREIATGKIGLDWRDRTFRVRVYQSALPVAMRAWPMLLRPLLAMAEAERGVKRAVLNALRLELGECERLAALAMPRSPREAAARKGAERAARDRFAAWVSTTPRAARWLGRLLEQYQGEEGLPRIQKLLAAQHYRLAYWRNAAFAINYRRYFDINDLGALRVEVPRVFDAMHETILRLIREGVITGLRIDHPDGLRDPAGYYRRLQAHCTEAARAAPKRMGLRIPNEEAPFHVVAEKIGYGGEPLRADWAIHGSTGYDFLGQANGVFVVPDHEQEFLAFYETLNPGARDPAALLHACKRFVLEEYFGGELERLTHAFRRALPPPIPPESVARAALAEALAAFPVYRSYVTGQPVSAEDRVLIESALEAARRRAPELGDTLERLGALLTLSGEAGGRPEALAFTAAFQQLSPPVIAKGLEDTALYRYFPLISVGLVGPGTEPFGQSIEDFHQANLARLRTHPFSLLATSTHDTKRSEDVRARVNALSEIPQAWAAAVTRWMAMNARHRRRVKGTPAPDANEEYLLYQTLIGAWPLGGLAGPHWAEFSERMQAYMEKALREAKVHTSWSEPKPEYEEAVSAFVDAILDTSVPNPFPEDLERFLEPVIRAGFCNALARTVLKTASPGVPDFYQGTELWDFSLVDPDNRRQVDFQPRRTMLLELEREAAADPAALAARLMAEPEDGRVKLYVTSRLLRLRRAERTLFSTGAYLPLDTEGIARRHAIAFARTEGARRVIAVVSRFHLILAGRKPPVGSAWQDTTLRLPEDWKELRFRDVFTGIVHAPVARAGALALADVFRHLPVALLEGIPA